MKFLGIYGGFGHGGHDANFCYSDGTKVRYFKPERYKQIKHFMYSDADELLNDIVNIFKINISDLDAVALCGAIFTYGGNITKKEEKVYTNIFDCPVYELSHHYCHALSCWTENNKKVNKSFVLDGTGTDSETITLFENYNVEQKYFLDTTLSLGRALRILGQSWGIQGHRTDIAGKLMALQSYGKIDNDLYNKIKNFNVLDLHDIFESFPEHEDLNWIRTVHHHCEQIFPEFFKSNVKNNEVVSFSGGVAQNIIINTKLKQWNKDIIIPAHCTDEGVSLGCIEFLRIKYSQEPFDTEGYPYWQQDDVVEIPTKQTIKKAAEQIARGKIVGWCQGKGEIGPRALGNRSILMRPDIFDGKDIINKRVKHREWYRPFGCSVLYDESSIYFDMDFESPYMQFSVPVKQELPSITHVDGTSRPQTVKDGIFAELLHEVKKLTGTSVVLNTSLNVNGKPIATPESLSTLTNSGIDCLFIGNSIIEERKVKNECP